MTTAPRETPTPETPRRKKPKIWLSKKERIHQNGAKLTKIELQYMHDCFVKYNRDVKMLQKVLPFSRSTIYKYLKDFSWTPSGRKCNSGKSTSESMLDFIDFAFKELPTIKLCELKQIIREGLNLSISPSQLSKVKRSYLFITFKRCEKIAKYRATDRVQALRKIYRELVTRLEIEHLYFIDESHVCLDHVVRVAGHSTVNTPCINIAHRISGRRYSLLACINYVHGWFFHELVDTTEVAINAQRFKGFMHRLISRLPAGAIIVMDNASIHKSDDIRSLVRGSGIHYVYQSPYSPDYNPIEYCFGWIKKSLKNYEFSTEPLETLIEFVLNDLTIELVQSFCRFSRKHWFNENKI